MARFNLILSEEEDKRFKKAIPAGIRSEFIRSILSLGLDKVEIVGPGMIGVVIAGLVEIIPNPDCQNLVTSEEDQKVEKRESNSTDQSNGL